ncbi:MAG TPA: glycerol-3-phosphate 1-O-acyltransferase PlsY [Rhodocyclaceae bacterium]
MTASPLLLPLMLLAAYLLGSIPFAVVSSRLFGLADPRSYGSGNPGATNVLRSGSKAAAALTLIGDSAKGAIAVALGAAAGLADAGLIAVGLAAFLGHLFPLFLGFKGGKGVATAAGVLLAIDYRLGLGVLAVWVGVAVLSRYSSLAALVAAASAPLLAYLMGGTSAGGIALLGLMSVALIAKHHANIKRLLAGEEGRIGRKKA